MGPEEAAFLEPAAYDTFVEELVVQDMLAAAFDRHTAPEVVYVVLALACYILVEGAADRAVGVPETEPT